MRGSVLGYVVRAQDGGPVADATVAMVRGPGPAPDIAFITDDAGGFVLRDLPRGKWVLSATSPDGLNRTATVYVFDNALSEVTIELPELKGGGQRGNGRGRRNKPGRWACGDVQGRVMQAENGAPVAGAVIGVVDGPKSPLQPTAVTDRSGYFLLLALPEGEWVLSATSSGKRGRARVRVTGDAASEVTIEIAGLPRAPRGGVPGPANDPEKSMFGTVRGRVVRADGRATLEDAAITVVRGPGPAPDISPITDGAGRFELDGLPPGEWLLRALGREGEVGEESVVVSAGAVTNTVIEVRPTAEQDRLESD